MKKAGIIGLGLLGGSFGLALREKGIQYHRTGYDINLENAKKALELGLVDEIAAFTEVVSQSDVLILATPVDVLVDQIPVVLSGMRSDALLLDLGSTKHAISEAASSHEKRGRFVASHPIAGTENSGPGAALAQLFSGKMIIICDAEKSDKDALNQAVALFNSLDMRIEFMSAKAHDEHIAFVSHLSHVSSFALGSAVLDMEKNEKNIFIMAGSGFDSTVRLAKSSPDMWTPIFSQNKKNITKALGMYIERLEQFKIMLEQGDQEAMHAFMKEANEIRRVLKNPL